MAKPLISRSFWVLFYLFLFAFVGFLFVSAILPAYRSPDTRLWSTNFGYPAMLRRFGLPVPVEVGTPEVRSIRDRVSAAGSLEYMHSIDVNVEMPGIVASLSVRPGDIVSRGQTLMTIDTGGKSTSLARIDLRQKEFDYQKAKQDYERQQEANRKGLVSAADLLTAEQRYRDAESEYLTSQEKLKQTLESRSMLVDGTISNAKPLGDQIRILAPSAGRVITVQAEIGENIVQLLNRAITIGDKLMFQSPVDQLYFSRVKVGDAATVYLSALQGQPLTAKIERIDPYVADETESKSLNRPPYTFLVWLAIDPGQIAGDAITSGMNGYCVFDRSFSSLALPERSLMRYSAGYGLVLRVNQNDLVETVPVTYSASDGGWVAITSGIAPGDRIIRSGQTGLQAGDHVQVR